LQQRRDRQYMQMALSLARRGLGSCWPNPSVGCIIVDQKGHIIGRGYTGRGGRPHAEVIALAAAGDAAAGAVAYVTLEPCAHHGKTPPCAEALITARIARVVVATGDPDARVSGQGIARLRQANIQVDFGLCQTEADDINQGFLKRITEERPMITLKMATSQDGMIAGPAGQSQWITSPESRRRGHLLRANHDAILVGIGTILADNPSLDCRLAGLEDRSPVRLVLDSHLKIPDDCAVVDSARKIPTWVITGENKGEKRTRLEHKGVKVIHCVLTQDGRIDLKKMMSSLAAEGITRLLSEGGAQVNASLIRTSLVDRLYWFQSTDIIGTGGLAALPSNGLIELQKSPDFSLVRRGRIGNDIWQEYRV